MSSIDDRIVQMQFDNKQFESGIQSTLKSIDNLKKGLNFDASTQSLSDLEKAGKRFDLSSIAAGVESLTNRFSNLGIIGITALQNITNAAIRTGTQLAKSLTIDPISTGFQEYETKMNAITTILTNTQDKGTTLDDVNEALAELNEYADKTIYNFAEMTRNIGTFTAAGVDLETATSAIKGIANLAAGSGSTPQQAATAMYQLSQAIASGRVSLQDWNSVVNAGMGGQLFQNALKTTAKEMGIVVDESVSFRESISSYGGTSWLTSDVLVKTLEKFAEDETLVKAATQVKTVTQLLDTMKESVQSGWSTSWEYIIGDREEAAEFLTRVNDAFSELIGSSMDARNSMLKFWHDNGGREAIIDAIFNSFHALQEILTPIHDAFEEVFPPMTGERLVEISNAIRDFTANFKISGETLDNLKRTFKGFFSLIDIGVQGVSAFVRFFSELLGYVAPAGKGILSFTAGIGDFITGIDEAIKAGDLFTKGFQKILDVINPVISGFKELVKVISDAISGIFSVDTSGLDTFSEKIQARLTPFAALGSLVSSVIGKIVEISQKAFPVLAKLGSIVADAFQNTAQGIADSLGNFDFNNIFDIINSGLFAAILLGIRKFFSSLTSVTDKASGVVGNLKGILDGVKGSLEAWQMSIKSDVIMKIAGAIAILTAALVVLSLIDSEKLTSSLTSVTMIFVDLLGSMLALDKVLSGSKISGIAGISTAMIAMSVGILILSSALKSVSELNTDQVWTALAALTGISVILVSSAAVLSKISGGFIRSAVGLIAVAGAIQLISGVVTVLGKLDFETLKKGVISIGALLAELAIFLKIANFDSFGVFKGTGLVILAAGMQILANVVAQFKNIDEETIIKGISSIGFILLEIAAFLKLTRNAKHVISTATSLTIIAASLLIFQQSISQLGALPIEQLAKGLVSIGIALTAVAGAMKLMPKNAITRATGFVIVSSAILILTQAFRQFETIGWETIGKGLAVISASLLIISTAMWAMKKALPGAAALLVVSSALLVFVPVLKILGSMSLTEIGLGLLALAGAFTVLGVAGAALGSLTPTLLALSGAFVIFGLGITAIGAGVLAFATGMSVLAVSGVAGAAALGAAISAIIGLIPAIIKQIGVGIVEFAGVITDGATAIAEAFTAIIVESSRAVVKVIPVLLDSVGSIITSIGEFLIEKIPEIGNILVDLFIGALGVVSDRMPDIVEAAIKVVNALLQSLSSVFSEFDASSIPGAIGAITGLVVIFGILAAASAVAKQAIKGAAAMTVVVLAIAAMLAIVGSLPIDTTLSVSASLSTLLISLSASLLLISKAPIAGALSGIAGFAAFVAALTAVLAVLGGLNQIPGFSWLIDEGSKVLGSLGNAIGSFVGNIVSGFLTGMSSAFPRIGQQLSDFMTNAAPFFEGIKNVDSSSLSAIQSLASAILMLTASDVLDGLTSWFTGGSSLVKFGEELSEFAPYFKRYYDSIEGIDGKVVESSANAAKSLAEFANNIPNAGGVASWFAGENSLSVFAEELVKFGPSLKQYADSVSGLDSEVVTNSANAAKALSELAANLPNSGGLVSWFTGDNDIGEFGRQLGIFGPALKRYATSVSGMDSEVVVNSANAAKALSELAANLPNSGGIGSWFAGDNTLDTFGSQLSSFGGYLVNYSNQVSAVDVGLLSSITAKVFDLAALADKLSNTDVWGLTQFATALESAGNLGIDRFISAFNDAEKLGKDAGKSLADSVTDSMISSVKGKSENIKESARTVATTFTDYLAYTFEQRTVPSMSAVYELFDALVLAGLDVLKAAIVRFNEAGQKLMDALKEGIRSGRTACINAISYVLDGCLNKVDLYDEFYNSGYQMMVGLASGITSNRSLAINAAANAAASTLNAAKRELDIHSPSKEMEELGRMSDMGLANGLLKFAGLIKNASSKVVSGSINMIRKGFGGVSSIIYGEIGDVPVIRPVLDLSGISSGASTINGMLGGARTIRMSASGFGYSLAAARGISKSIEQERLNSVSIVPASNRDVVDAISSLGDRIDGVSRSVAAMKVVMDTGATVGQMESTIDKRLGIIAARKERGI